MDEQAKNDLRKSTVTLYYSQRSQSARPAPVQARVPAGPGAKLIGGFHTHVYEERAGHNTTAAGANGATSESSPSTSQAWASRVTGRPGMQASQTGGSLTGTKKVVYWTGRDHHIVDAPTHATGEFKWTPPHLKQVDVEPGPQLAVRETPGAARIKLIGSKYRYLPSMEPYGGSMWAVSPEVAALYGSVGSNTWGSGGVPGAPNGQRPSTAASPYTASLEAYARQRIIGYKEYEATSKLLNGVGSWERTQRHLTQSMDVGRPSKLMSPAQTTFRGLSTVR
ncbi:hypothetical protein HYH03_016662 [Edaphochlamys debaryana]|uniref:Uncharacterized protein n=1 Tax=Edaphochlamys debaryana TaxID=47281 RepID=A0A836BR81_9CHLO|nr:hypothetical protein HYH03_016662 [Edaphochlamys debaryana]|eukprot:KAG2484524.1 hypothetical protein HYH03_016662 [Edaphochlamys debaryana]